MTAETFVSLIGILFAIWLFVEIIGEPWPTLVIGAAGSALIIVITQSVTAAF